MSSAVKAAIDHARATVFLVYKRTSIQSLLQGVYATEDEAIEKMAELWKKAMGKVVGSFEVWRWPVGGENGWTTASMSMYHEDYDDLKDLPPEKVIRRFA